MAQAWLRLYREMVLDPKFSRLYGGQRHLWTVLLCLADDDGMVKIADGVPYNDEELAHIAGIDRDEATAAIEWFSKLGMIDEDDDGVLIITNWDKRQFKSDDSTERVRKHREKRYRNVAVTPPETETDTETDTEAEERQKPKRKRFVPPTLDEVETFVSENTLKVDPRDFLDFYQSKDWMVGKSKMKDWRAACRRAEKWESNQRKFGAGDSLPSKSAWADQFDVNGNPL